MGLTGRRRDDDGGVAGSEFLDEGLWSGYLSFEGGVRVRVESCARCREHNRSSLLKCRCSLARAM